MCFINMWRCSWNLGCGNALAVGLMTHGQQIWSPHWQSLYWTCICVFGQDFNIWNLVTMGLDYRYKRMPQLLVFCPAEQKAYPLQNFGIKNAFEQAVRFCNQRKKASKLTTEPAFFCLKDEHIWRGSVQSFQNKSICLGHTKVATWASEWSNMPLNRQRLASTE